MRIRVRAYGIAGDIAGKAFEMDVDGVTVGDLRKALHVAYPALGNLASLLIAVNQSYVADDSNIKDTDEIVLIPPVSGG